MGINLSKHVVYKLWKSTFLALCIVLGTINANAAKQDPIKLQLKWRNQFQFAGYYAAQIKGFYKNEGLNVEIIPGGPGVSPVERVYNGKADVGVFDSGILLKQHQAKQMCVLATIMQSSGYCVVSLKSKNITKPADLVGKNILADHDQGWGIFKAILKKEGLDPTKIRVTDRSKDSEEIGSPDVDAVVTYITSQPQRLRNMGYQINIMRPEEYGVDFYGDVIFSTKKFAYDDTKRTDAFIRASLKGWKYALAHQEELIDYILTLPDVKAYGVTRDELVHEAKEVKRLIMPDLVEVGHNNLGRWDYMLHLLQELNLADKDFNLAKFVYMPGANNTAQWLVPLIYVSIFILSIAVGISLINVQLRKRVKLKTQELVTEIEQRKHAEKMANESREQIELILENSDIGLWTIQLDDNKSRFSKEFKRILSYPESHEFTEANFFKKIHPEDLRLTQKLFDKNQDGARKKMVQFRIENAHGEYIYVISSAKLISENGKTTKISGVLLSIDELKKKQIEIMEVSQELTRRNDELKKFAYITSHNLRAPIVNLSSLAAMINSKDFDDENQLIFSKIQSSIKQLESTLDDLIEVVSQEKIQTHTIDKIDVAQAISDVTQSLEQTIIESGLSLTLDLAVADIYYPKPYFQSIIQNLLTNAIKYRSPERPLVIKISTSEDNNYTRFTFADNGIGIDMEKNKFKIFGLYQRFNPEVQGKGIGLFIIKSHLDALNGKIEVDSTVGKGTCFTLLFRR